MEPRSRSKLNTQIYEEACEWFVTSRAGELDEAQRRDLDRWLRKSPENLGAYLEIAAIWGEADALDPGDHWNEAKLIAEAAAERDNVVEMPGTGVTAVAMSSASRPRDAGGNRSRWRLAAIAAGMAILGGLPIVASLLSAPIYSTGVGEQRSVVLADGSTVELNSRSKLHVRYSREVRAVELLEGQALFRVSKDHARPFVVTSGLTRIQAVGTQFDVYKKHGGTIVTVVEGRVAILRSEDRADGASAGGLADLRASDPAGTGVGHAHAQPAILLGAGEQLAVTPGAAERVPHPNITGATAWKQRQLVFDAASLAEVAEEFNRYNARQLVIDASVPQDFHISGVFSSADTSALIRFLRARPGLQVIEAPSEIRVERNSSPRG
jgi:transmembrane sensor